MECVLKYEGSEGASYYTSCAHGPHLGLVEMLARRKMVDLLLVEALRIP
jgi:hypothetical protein